MSPFGSSLSQKDHQSKALQTDLQTWRALHIQSKDSATSCMSDLSLLSPMGRNSVYSPRKSRPRGARTKKKEINIKSRAFDFNNILSPTVTTIVPKVKEKQSRPQIIKVERLAQPFEKQDASQCVSHGVSQAVDVEIRDQVTQSHDIDNTIMTLYQQDSGASHRVDVQPPNILSFSKQSSRLVLDPQTSIHLMR